MLHCNNAMQATNSQNGNYRSQYADSFNLSPQQRNQSVPKINGNPRESMEVNRIL